MSRLERELEDTKRELERKEKRLAQRNSAVDELLAKIEAENKKFDIALKGEFS